MNMYPAIVSVGQGLPQHRLTNQELIKLTRADITPQQIQDNTGIAERRWAEDELTSDLAEKAAMQALTAGGIDVSALTSIYLATCTPDQPSPNTASIVHGKLDAPEACLAVDLHASCAGGVIGLEAAAHRVMAEPDGSALVVGANTLSRSLDCTDPKTVAWFGDGAGAAVVQMCPDGQPVYSAMITQPNKQALQTTVPDSGDPCGIMHMNDEQAVRRHAIDIMSRATTTVAQKADLYHPDDGIDWSSIDYFIPHQANARLVEQVAQMVNVPQEKCILSSVAKHGNTSSASIFLALSEAVTSGQIKPGRSRALFAAVGAGFVGGALLIDLVLP